MIASMLSLTPVMIDPKSDVGSSSMVAQLVLGAPSWTSSTTTSAPSVLSWLAAVLTELTMSVTWTSWIPAGETSSGRCSVTAPTNPTLTPSIVLVHVSGISGLLSLSLRTLAAMYCQFAPPYGLLTASYGCMTRSVRSSAPWSNSWLPAAETSRPASFRASIVGLSFWMNDSNVEAPIRSPAAANTVSGFWPRSCLTAPASTAAPAVGRRGVVLEPTVEVVGPQDLDRLGGVDRDRHLDRGAGRRAAQGQRRRSLGRARRDHDVDRRLAGHVEAGQRGLGRVVQGRRARAWWRRA